MYNHPTREKIYTTFLSSLGGGLEYYDFVIFIIFAKYLGENFFPSSTIGITLIKTYSIFAVGYLARPIGGIIFGHLGDKFGRKKTFTFTLSVMALATFCMSLIPSYQSLGISATILFVLLRIIQGLALGGEIPGAFVFLKEHYAHNVGASFASIFIFINLGILLAHGINYMLLHLLSAHQMNFLGWRIAFIIGGVLALISYFMRRNLLETPEFLELSKQDNSNKALKSPLHELIRFYSRDIIYGIILSAPGALLVSLLYFYMPSYLNSFVGMSNSKASSLSLLGLISFSIFSPCFAFCTDFMDKNKILFLGLFIFIFLSYPFYTIISYNTGFLGLYFILMGFCSGLITGVFPIKLAELFPVKVRYTGVAICYNVTFAIFGGMAPLVATLIINHTNNLAGPAFLLIGIAFISSIFLLLKGQRKYQYDKKTI